MAAASSSASPSAPPSTVSIHGSPVPITAEPGLSVEAVLASVPFSEWCASLDRELTIESIHVQSVDMFGPRVGFVKFRAVALYRGVKVPGIVFMRGGAVAILVILHCEDERFVLFCRQPRVPVGAAGFYEIPAGMLDGDGHFAGVAAKEMKEETGIEIADKDLVDLTGLAFGAKPIVAGAAATTTTTTTMPTTTSSSSTTATDDGRGASSFVPRGMYPSAGGCDEFLRLFAYERAVTRAELADLQGRLTGCPDEGEVISLELCRYEDAWRFAPDAKTLSAIFLYEKLKASGAIPA